MCWSWIFGLLFLTLIVILIHTKASTRNGQTKSKKTHIETTLEAFTNRDDELLRDMQRKQHAQEERMNEKLVQSIGSGVQKELHFQEEMLDRLAESIGYMVQQFAPHPAAKAPQCPGMLCHRDPTLGMSKMHQYAHPCQHLTSNPQSRKWMRKLFLQRGPTCNERKSFFNKVFNLIKVINLIIFMNILLLLKSSKKCVVQYLLTYLLQCHIYI